jgi:aminoglycoside phosphotransferase (APT) family kinase protein
MDNVAAVNVTPATIAAIVMRFKLGTHHATRLVHPGTSHTVYFLDDTFVLRIPRNHPAFTGSVAIEAIAVPSARGAGVHTPALVATDETCELLPVPYAIYERVPGVSLAQLDLAPETTPQLWRQLGQDLARLHHGVAAVGPATQLAVDVADLDPRPWLAEIHAAGFIPQRVAAALQTWLDQLAPMALAGVPCSFCHGDVNVSNIIVDARTYDYHALIDWAGAIWGDSAWDLAVVSLHAAPWLLEGYRTVAPLPHDSTAEARILWNHLRLALFSMRGAPQHGHEWANQRLGRLLLGMRAFLSNACPRWLTDLGPADLGD